MIRVGRTLGLCALSLTAACSPAPLPAPVTQADAVADSAASDEASTLAPQAFAEAEKLLAEAHWLHDEGRHEESAAAGEEAISAYSRAFALARAARAQIRVEEAQKAQDEAAAHLAELDRLQNKVAADADAFEMRARVHLDTEEVKDVEGMTADRARARRLAARQLAAEARLLCIGALLLDSKASGVVGAQKEIETLETELSQGSVKDDLYPRGAEVRAQCLKHLTEARRPVAKQAPQSADSDRLLAALTETGKVFAFRDDRGIVVNLGKPLDDAGALTEESRGVLELLGGTAKAHPLFPVLVVAHSAKSGQNETTDKMGEAARAALTESGAKDVRVESVSDAQPLVHSRVRGADEKNERIEIVFVVPGR